MDISLLCLCGRVGVGGHHLVNGRLRNVVTDTAGAALPDGHTGVDRDEACILEHLDLAIPRVLLNKNIEQSGLLTQLLGKVGRILDGVLDDALEDGDLEARLHVKNKRIDVVRRADAEVVTRIVQLGLQLLKADDKQAEPILDGFPSLLAAFNDALDDNIDLRVVFGIRDDQEQHRLLLTATRNQLLEEHELFVHVERRK